MEGRLNADAASLLSKSGVLVCIVAFYDNLRNCYIVLRDCVSTQVLAVLMYPGGLDDFQSTEPFPIAQGSTKSCEDFTKCIKELSCNGYRPYVVERSYDGALDFVHNLIKGIGFDSDTKSDYIVLKNTNPRE